MTTLVSKLEAFIYSVPEPGSWEHESVGSWGILRPSDSEQYLRFRGSPAMCVLEQLPPRQKAVLLGC